LDAQLLVAEVLQQPRTWVIAHEEYPLQAGERQRLDTLLTQRLDGVPLAYLTGWREFDGLRLKVTADVLVPRADTETLVEWASEFLQEHAHSRPAAQVLDLGTGSGAIALALKHRHPSAEVTGTDSSAAALSVARDNAQRLQLDVQWLMGRWFEPVRGRRFDMVVSNPPYIPTAVWQELEPQVRNHEPALALDGGDDGLAAIRAIASQAAEALAPGGYLLLEHHHDQSGAVVALLEEAGLEQQQAHPDLEGVQRFASARKPGHP